MGGGDLNLKKSWHPHTLKNQERVWKAEQQKAEEDRKVAELQREIKEERERELLQRTAEKSGAIEKKGDAKLDWMYKGPGGHVSREEYLLGRKIDNSFEQLEKAEAEEKVDDNTSALQNKPVYTIEHEINPESVVRRESANVQVDMRRKLMEDPLLLIRQREEETKREITANPVKMKQLQQLIASIKSKRKKTKKRKKKKKKHSRNSSSSSDSDSDDKRSRKKKKKTRKRPVSSSDSSDSSESSTSSSSSSSSSEDERKRKKKKLKKDKTIKHKDKEEKEKRHGKTSREENENYKKDRMSREENENYKKDRMRDGRSEFKYDQNINRTTNRDMMRHRDSGPQQSREMERWQKNQDKYGRYRRPQEHSRSRSRSRDRKNYGERSRNSDSQGTNKHRLSEKEMEKKRQEMMDAAHRRDEDRKENVQRYAIERKKEEEMEKDVEKFRRNNLLSAASKTSIEDRVKSRMSSSQRGPSHMETNFARK